MMLFSRGSMCCLHSSGPSSCASLAMGCSVTSASNGRPAGRIEIGMLSEMAGCGYRCWRHEEGDQLVAHSMGTHATPHMCAVWVSSAEMKPNCQCAALMPIMQRLTHDGLDASTIQGWGHALAVFLDRGVLTLGKLQHDGHCCARKLR